MLPSASGKAGPLDSSPCCSAGTVLVGPGGCGLPPSTPVEFTGKVFQFILPNHYNCRVNEMCDNALMLCAYTSLRAEQPVVLDVLIPSTCRNIIVLVLPTLLEPSPSAFDNTVKLLTR